MNKKKGSYIFFNTSTKENNCVVYNKINQKDIVKFLPLNKNIIQKENHDYIYNIYLVQNKNVVKTTHSGTFHTIVDMINSKKALALLAGYDKISKLLTIEKEDYNIYLSLQ